jgi:hypothetical protein|nr:MAG TPA: hypothetical protein [Caudoviricetes sp.]
MLGYFGKEVVSSPYRPSKEDVDNYILAKDKEEFKRKLIRRRMAANATGALVGSGVGIGAVTLKFGYDKNIDPYLIAAGGAGSLVAAAAGRHGAKKRNVLIEKIANSPSLYRRYYGGKNKHK